MKVAFLFFAHADVDESADVAIPVGGQCDGRPPRRRIQQPRPSTAPAAPGSLLGVGRPQRLQFGVLRASSYASRLLALLRHGARVAQLAGIQLNVQPTRYLVTVQPCAT